MKERFLYCGFLCPVVVSELNLWAGVTKSKSLREQLTLLFFFFFSLFSFYFPFPFSCKEYRNALDELSKASLKNSSEEGLQPNRLHAGTTVHRAKAQ